MSQAFTAENLKKYSDRLDSDFPFAARHTLKIKSKMGTIDPFILNQAQRYIHERIEHQKMATGKVRAVILKGRQQGASTYISGRFYWRTTRVAGVATFILSHEAGTTEKLFSMVSRYHENMPKQVQATTDTENKRRMVFAGLGSEYFVGTAGNDDVGRGGTIQQLHASEAAFYPGSGIGIKTGLLQSVPNAPNTEIIIESTANGMDPLFYPMAMDALAGRGEYILIFVPWFWQQEYRATPPEGFTPDAEEEELQRLYNLDAAQLYWRRLKIFELKDKVLFMREYPCSVEEAFIVSGDSFIPMLHAAAARKNLIEDPAGPLIVGADPNESRGPGAIVWRRGRRILKVRLVENKGPMEWVDLLAEILRNDNPAMMFLDNGNGYGIIDRLIELGWSKKIMGINFGGGAVEEELYLNKRAEMAKGLQKWFANGPVQVPDDDLFQKHLCCVPAEEKTSSNLTKLVEKKIIIKNTQIDPHLFDAAILTFANPVQGDGDENEASNHRVRKIEKAKSPLKSIQRREQMGGSVSKSVFAEGTLKL